jgi:hypothetical protein
MLTHWIAIIILILIALTLIKLEHHTKAIKMFLIIIIGAILYFSIISVFSSSQVDLTSPKGIINGAYLYMGWMGQTASSLWNIGEDTVTLVGNAIKINNTEG